MSREAIQQALDALTTYDGTNGEGKRRRVLAALRERLAQPEQDWDWRHPKAQALIGAKARLEIQLRLVEQLVEDPNLETTASDMEYWEPLHDKLQERLAQPEMEPCAGRNCGSTNPNLHSAECFEDYEQATGMNQWVGLTADEIWKCNRAKSGSAVEFHICSAHQNVLDFAEAIEAKLKEKNT